jgi:hypothetical protein
VKVEAERTYHQRVLQILDQLEGEVCNHVTMSLTIMLFTTRVEFMVKWLQLFSVSICDFLLSIFVIDRWFPNDNGLKLPLVLVWITPCLHLPHMKKLMAYMLLKQIMEQQTPWATF